MLHYIYQLVAKFVSLTFSVAQVAHIEFLEQHYKSDESELKQ